MKTTFSSLLQRQDLVWSQLMRWIMRLMATWLMLMAWSTAVQATVGRVSHFPVSDGQRNFQVQYLNETSLLLRREVRNNMNELIQTQDCFALGNSCFGAMPAGAASYSITLENFDPNKYEIISETCNGVLSTVIQRQCMNGPYQVNIKLRLGTLVIRNAFVAGQMARPLGLDASASGFPRLVFADDETKYWNRFAPNGTIPAGSYKLVGLARATECKPVQMNTDELFTVPAGGTVTFTVIYRMTDCLITVKVDKSFAGSTPFSINGLAFTCVPEFSSQDSCTARAAYGTTINLSASVPAGFNPSFDNQCAGNVPRQTCSKSADRDLFFRMSIIPGAAPPPPPPTVTLSIEAGPESPVNTEIAKGATDVPLVQLRLTPRDGTARLDSLSLAASGTGRDDLDLTQLRLIHDTNANGIFDAGETVLASGRFNADNGSMSFSLGTPLVVAAVTHVLVVGDVNSSVMSASLWLGGGASLLLFGALQLPAGWGGSGGPGGAGMLLRMWRRLRLRASTRARSRSPAQARSQRMACLSVLMLSTAMLASCGGGSDPAVQTPAPAPVPVPAPPPPPLPPPPTALTYQVRVTAVRAVDATTPTTVISVSGVPISGATISVQP